MLLEMAGPRGATFMGRYIPQGSNPALSQLLSRPANEPIEGEGMGGMGAIIGLGATAKVLPFPEGNLANRVLQSKKVAPEYLEWYRKYHKPAEFRMTLKNLLGPQPQSPQLIKRAAQLEDALSSGGKYTVGRLNALKASHDDLQLWVNFLLNEMK
mgnify:FL=1